jgi:hypothetical protein
LSNQNSSYMGYSVVNGRFSNVSTKLDLKTFMTGRPVLSFIYLYV